MHSSGSAEDPAKAPVKKKLLDDYLSGSKTDDSTPDGVALKSELKGEDKTEEVEAKRQQQQ